MFDYQGRVNEILKGRMSHRQKKNHKLICLNVIIEKKCFVDLPVMYTTINNRHSMIYLKQAIRM